MGIVRKSRKDRQFKAVRSLPCVKGGGFAKSKPGGIVMQYKHNKQLVSLAKQLRKEMTKEERHIWYDFLKTYPVRFLRQKVIGKYIVDFYCAKAQLVVELDGSQHFEENNEINDSERTAFLQSYGLRVIRIPNNQINRNFQRPSHSF